MPSPVDVKALANRVDLSDFAGRGIFNAWGSEVDFGDVHVGDQGQIAWNDELEVCADTLYMRLTGKTPEEVFPNLGEIRLNA